MGKFAMAHLDGKDTR